MLASVTMEGIGLSHILHVEKEKLQPFLTKDKLTTCKLLEINQQVNELLNSGIKSQILLQMKLGEVS